MEVLNFLEGEGWVDAFRNQDEEDAEYDELDGGALWREKECIKFGIQKCKIYVPGVQDE